MPDRGFARYLAVVFARLVICCDALMGIGWTFGSPARSMTPAYAPARVLFDPLPGDPARAWGGVLLALALIAAAAMVSGADHYLRWAFAALAGYWSFWAFLFATSALTEPHAGLVPIGFALMSVVGNVRPVFAPSTVSVHR